MGGCCGWKDTKEEKKLVFEGDRKCRRDQPLPQEKGMVCFRGYGKDIDLETARKKAKYRILEDYAMYVGVPLYYLILAHREEIKSIQDEIYKHRGKEISEMEGFIFFYSRGIQFVDECWERWKGNGYFYYVYWLFGCVDEKYVQEERTLKN